MTTVSQAFDLPSRDDIRAMAFVVRLSEADPASVEVKQRVDEYVITPTVEKELPLILRGMRQVFHRGEDYGRFIHGSFGSGKSHFMTLLSMLLEGVPVAWDKFRPVLQAQQTANGEEVIDHEAWLKDAKLLVVRVHMLTVAGRQTGLDRAIYTGFNEALKRRAKAPFEFLNVDGILQEILTEAKEYGDVVWKRLEAEGILGGQEDFEAMASGSAEERENLARAWLDFKGRSAETAGIDPNWTEGLKRMAQHAKAQGFGGLVLMLDEFLLWLAEKERGEFIQAINNLNLIVDHTTGQRSVPIFAFVARQRNLQEFFPDLTDESGIYEHIDHHSKRFEISTLEDIELRHIVKGRILKARLPEEVKKATDALAQKHERILPALLADGDIGYLRDVYPFHPALIEMLVDVTSLMQRERSALRLLYELLVLHHPELELGEFLPVGSAFEALFPPSGVEASKKIDLMQDIHRQYYQRLKPAIQRMAEDPGMSLTPERARALDQMVKTVLLAEVSPRLRGAGGLTIERLVQLNAAEVEGETFRGQLRVAETDLTTLARIVPDLQIAGTDRTAVVRYVLGRVSLTEFLSRARSKVDNAAQRFKVFYPALKEALGIADLRGFEEGGPNEGDWDLSWRKTPRKGQLRICNLREVPQATFEPPAGTFKTLVDYPWDEPGHGVEEDRHAAERVRRKKGMLYTACWLPRHFTAQEMEILVELAAVRYLRSKPGQEELLDTLGPQDRAAVLEQADTRQRNLEGQLNGLLKEVYLNHGECLALIDHADTRLSFDVSLEENLKSIATRLMDRQFPQHPQFLSEPKRADLELLLKWMVEAGETSVSVLYDEATGRVLRNLGQPLELVNLGQTKAQLRLDTRYIADVLSKVDKDTVDWSTVVEHLRTTYGLPSQVIDLFLCFICQRTHRALNANTLDPVDVLIGMSSSSSVRLQRGSMVDAPAWGRLRSLGNLLFGESVATAYRTLQIQDKFCLSLRSHARDRRTILQQLHQRIQELGIQAGDRLTECAEANARLAPLDSSSTDSSKLLSDFLAKWPETPSDPAVVAVQQADKVRGALDFLNGQALRTLRAAKDHPTLGTEVHGHLRELDEHLAGAQSKFPITEAWVRTWNKGAEDLTHQIVKLATAQVQPPPEPPRPVPSPPEPPPAKPVTPPAGASLKRRVDPSNADEVSDFLGLVRKQVEAVKSGPVTWALIQVEEDE